MMAKKQGGWTETCIARLRKFHNVRTKALAKLKQLNEELDANQEKIAEASSDAAKERIKAQCWDIERGIENQRASIKWAASSVFETIGGADQGMLFEDDNPTMSRDGDAHLFDEDAPDAVKPEAVGAGAE